jgi:hypothetical protein
MFVAWTISSAVYENSGESNSAAGYVQIPFVWLFGVFYSFAWSGLLVAYALEVLPFKLRAKGLMIMNITVQAILAVGKSVYARVIMAMRQLLTLWTVKPILSRGRTFPTIGTLLSSILFGLLLNSFSCTLCTFRTFTSTRTTRC